MNKNGMKYSNAVPLQEISPFLPLNVVRDLSRHIQCLLGASFKAIATNEVKRDSLANLL